MAGPDMPDLEAAGFDKAGSDRVEIALAAGFAAAFPKLADADRIAAHMDCRRSGLNMAMFAVAAARRAASAHQNLALAQQRGRAAVCSYSQTL